jgi:hypothetical protein
MRCEHHHFFHFFLAQVSHHNLVCSVIRQPFHNPTSQSAIGPHIQGVVIVSHSVARSSPLLWWMTITATTTINTNYHAAPSSSNRKTQNAKQMGQNWSHAKKFYYSTAAKNLPPPMGATGKPPQRELDPGSNRAPRQHQDRGGMSITTYTLPTT